MAKVKYIGRHALVHVPDLGLDVENGQTVEVEDQALAERLLAQPTNWKSVGGGSPAPVQEEDSEEDEVE